jgi:hypothetical protein
MVTSPLFIILAVAAVVAVKWGPMKVSHLVLGVLLGLSLAATSLGPPILDGITSAMSSVVSTVSNVAEDGPR